MSKSAKRSTIKFTDYDVFGFDMDFTLARYKLVAFFDLTYGTICKYLVEKKNYDASIFHGLHEDNDKDLVYSGLLADCEKGNVLKVAENGSIIRATHGTRLMSDDEVSAAYGDQKMFPFYDDFINGVQSTDKKWRFFENYFDIPGMVAFAKIVDHLEEKGEKPKSYLQNYVDVTEAFEDMYVPTQFAKNKGVYFPTIKANPNKFIDQISEDIKTWLKDLRKDGRKVFLMTSSFTDYSDLIMTTMFGKEWKSYFDIYLYSARKPKFFTETKPFVRMDKQFPMEEVSKLEAGKDYCHGNLKDLTAFLKKITGKDDPKVMYFGDNLFSDAWPSTLLAGWDSVLILEEMDAEGYAVSDATVPGHEDELEDPAAVPAKRKRRYEHSSLATEEEIELMVSSFWGSVFVDHGIKSSSGSADTTTEEEDLKNMNTCYGHLIAKYATICVPSIEYLAGVPLDHEFSTFCGEPGNARGFHPGRPRSLLPE